MMRLHLVDDWRRSWRWASVRLAWLAGISAGVLTAYPDELKGLVAYVPEPWRPLASLAVALAVGGLPWLARVTKRKPADG
jgi:hypothetical protein